MLFKGYDGIENLSYLSLCMQALGVGTRIEALRRSMPHTMGSLYWQFNDVWPAFSWSSIDYYG
jgi:beta-mannosidase